MSFPSFSLRRWLMVGFFGAIIIATFALQNHPSSEDVLGDIMRVKGPYESCIDTCMDHCGGESWAACRDYASPVEFWDQAYNNCMGGGGEDEDSCGLFATEQTGAVQSCFETCSSASSDPGSSGGSSSNNSSYDGGFCGNEWQNECGDNIDNDDDGVADEYDPGCWMDGVNPSTYNGSLNHESRATTQCQDGIDNDNDLLTDINDPGCWTDPADPDTYSATSNQENAATSQCQDGIDNDNDAGIDERDPGCVYVTDYFETPDAPQCNDGRDNDGDGLTDLLDSDCSSRGDVTEVTNIANCDDEIDNDNDGTIDTNGFDSDNNGSIDIPPDVSCAFGTESFSPPQCDDGIDNDGDTLVDLNDSSCTVAGDAEFTGRPECNDDIDNDGDGYTDYSSDSGCASLADNVETNGMPACGDGTDNDLDGLVDMGQPTQWGRDPGCQDLTDTSESATDTNPHGTLDTPNPVCATLQGWVCPANNVSGTLTVEVYAYAERGQPGSVYLGTTQANLPGTPRIDLYCNGSSHRFSFAIPSPIPNPLQVPPPASLFAYAGDVLLGSAVQSCTDAVVPQCNDGIDNDFDGAIDMEDTGGCLSENDDDEFNHACGESSSSSSVDPSELLECTESTLIDFNDFPEGTPLYEVFEDQGLILTAECMVNGQTLTNSLCMGTRIYEGRTVMMVPPGMAGEGSEVNFRFINPANGSQGSMGNVTFRFGTVGENVEAMITASGPEYSTIIMIADGKMNQTVVTNGIPSVLPEVSADPDGTFQVDLGGPISQFMIQSS